ncbi:MAG: ATP-binding protein [Burkholderiales bacterium]
MSKTKAGERLPYLLSKLKAPRVLERLEQTAALAREQEWPYERFLETLLEAEVFARDASGARTRVRAAGFPALKTLEDFDWSAQPSAERPLVLHLAQLAWIEEQANVCFLGPPGTGKTHLAIALSMKACERGHRVAFATAQEWVSRLEAAQDRNQLEQELRRLERYHLLVVDLCRHRDYADIVVVAGLSAVWLLGFWPSPQPACRHSHRLSRNASTASGGL